MKHLYCAVVSLLLLTGFASCVEEDGPGVPSPKSLIIESDEYTLDMTETASSQSIVFRWVDVGNAAYTVAFTKAVGPDTESDMIEVLKNEVTAGELNVLSMTITKKQVSDYLSKAGMAANGNSEVTFTLTAVPVDLSVPTALEEGGSKKSAIIRVIGHSE